jgi:hypothetical protein
MLKTAEARLKKGFIGRESRNDYGSAGHPLLGGDPGSVISNLQDSNTSGSSAYVEIQTRKRAGRIRVGGVLADTRNAWNEIL